MQGIKGKPNSLALIVDKTVTLKCKLFLTAWAFHNNSNSFLNFPAIGWIFSKTAGFNVFSFTWILARARYLHMSQGYVAACRNCHWLWCMSNVALPYCNYHIFFLSKIPLAKRKIVEAISNRRQPPLSMPFYCRSSLPLLHLLHVSFASRLSVVTTCPMQARFFFTFFIEFSLQPVFPGK